MRIRLLNEIVADPDAFELTNVTTPGITPNVAPSSCKHADGFFFWDGIDRRRRATRYSRARRQCARESRFLDWGVLHYFIDVVSQK